MESPIRNNMSKKKETKLSKFMKMVVKARDLYIKSMNQLPYHDLPGGGMAFGIPVCHVNALPPSFSSSQSQNSVRGTENRVAELVRAASVGTVTIDETRHGPSTKLRKAKSVRSCDGHHHHHHHVFERIDETSPLIDFGNHHKMLQRSKSYCTYGLQ